MDRAPREYGGDDYRGGYRRHHSRSRSRSRSPPMSMLSRHAPRDYSDKHADNRIDGSKSQHNDIDTYEGERRARMERLRKENEEEERRLREAAEESLAKQQSAEEADPSAANQIKEFTREELEGLDPEEQMKMMMGIGDFGSTKGKTVKDNQVGASRGAASKSKARKYRQYMNRKGGFNRPLDKMG